MRLDEFATTLKKSGCVVDEMDVIYNTADCRCWTAVVNPQSDAILVTLVRNRLDNKTREFDIITKSGFVQDGISIGDIYDTIKSNLTD